MAKKRKSAKAPPAVAVDLSQLVPLPVAARLADVDETWMRRLVRERKVVGLKIGRNYLVDRASAASYRRNPAMGRPRTKGERDG